MRSIRSIVGALLACCFWFISVAVSDDPPDDTIEVQSQYTETDVEISSSSSTYQSHQDIINPIVTAAASSENLEVGQVAAYIVEIDTCGDSEEAIIIAGPYIQSTTGDGTSQDTTGTSDDNGWNEPIE